MERILQCAQVSTIFDVIKGHELNSNQCCCHVHASVVAGREQQQSMLLSCPIVHVSVVAGREQKLYEIIIIIIIYHDFLPTPKRGTHVKSDKTHT